MNSLRICIALVLAAFLAETAYVVYEYGYAGFFELANANAATRLMMFDLVIALSLFAVWMIRDAREQHISPLPYIVLTLTLGSAGPLAYLLRRQPTTASAAVPQQAA